MPGIWATLAQKYDGKDRWYLESLGIAAGADWDACLDAYLAKAGDSWNTPAGQDIIWRSRAKKTPSYLAKILKDDIAGLGPVRLRDVDEAQGAIVLMAKDLATQGQITLQDSRDEEMIA